MRSHVLSLREGELESRLKDRERDIEELRLLLRALHLTARKDQATIDAQVKRIAALEEQLLARPKRIKTSQSRREPQSKPKTSKKSQRAEELRHSLPKRKNAKSKRPPARRRR